MFNAVKCGLMTHELVSEKENGFQAELSVAKVEEILEGGAEEVEDHSVVVALCSEPSHERNAHASCESLVDLGLILELRVLCLY